MGKGMPAGHMEERLQNLSI